MSLSEYEQALLLAQCETVWCMLEQQNSAGVDWRSIEWMPDSLARVLPLKILVREHGGCRKIIRVFCPTQAKALLWMLEFPDIISKLNELGYERTRAEFIQRLMQWVQSEQYKQLSLF